MWRQVDADLVGPAGGGLAADEGEAAEPLDDFVEGDGGFAAVVGRRIAIFSRLVGWNPIVRSM